jgi:hypothetical protein
MRVAVLAMQEQSRLRRAGELALKESEVDVDEPRASSGEGFAIDIDDPEGDARRTATAESAWRLLVARLTGAAVSRASLEAMRAQHGEDSLLVATGGITNELLSSPGLQDRDVSAVARARAEARELIAAPADVAATPGLAAAAAAAMISSTPLSPSPPASITTQTSTSPSSAATTIPTAVAAPPFDPARLATTSADTTVQRVIARVVGAVTSGDDAPVLHGALTAPSDAAPLVVLRARAQTASSARSLQGVARAALARLPVRALDHAADELLLGAGTSDDALLDGSAVDDAVAVLVRAAAALAAALPEHAPIAFSLVVTGAHGDVVDAVVRAGAQLPRAGQLALDDDAWQRAGELATAPGETRVVDARTPWGVDRWQLSAALPRAPFVGRDEDVAACAPVLASSSPSSSSSSSSSSCSCKASNCTGL